MIFNSFQFLIFFIVVTPLYYITPFKWRWLLLLIASCYFYASFIPAYLLVLFAVITIDYIAGRLIESSIGKKRRLFLIMSLIANLGLLAIFKYYNFFVDNVNELLGLCHIRTITFPYWQMALPIGLSFHTFQAMSYTVEVYRGNQPAERHFGIYALYVMFYPQLVAGPIERPQELLYQFRERHTADYDGITDGLKKMLLGMFMKVVVADRLAIYVNYVYAHAEWHSRLALLTAVFFYSFQIYCDFAGYSLIAIGAARTMGFTLSDNFRQPYLTSSLTDFWRRWHITLSRWFRDYLYIPMGGSRTGTLRYVFNILVVFLLSGLWHGANWTFIVWGLLHGLIILFERFSRGKKTGNKAGITGMLCSFILVSLCWIFFRAASMADAFTIIHRIFSSATPWQIPGEFEERALLIYSLFGIGCILAIDIQKEFFGEKHLLLYHKNTNIRMAAVISLSVLILLLGVFDGRQFIYFQF